MKIFIVTSGDYDSYKIEAPFTDLEQAQKYVTRLEEQGVSNVEIKPMTADPIVEPYEVYRAAYTFAEGTDPLAKDAKPVLIDNGHVGTMADMPGSGAQFFPGTEYIIGWGYGSDPMEARDNLWAAIDKYRSAQQAS